MSIPGIRFEPLRWWHIDQCAELDRLLFPDSAWSAETFWSELARVPDSRHYVVAVNDDDRPTAHESVVGYAGLATVVPDADVQTIAVADLARGIGLGRALLDELLREAVNRGCSTVLLEVAADNDRAIGLYRSRHFVELSRRRDYYAPGRDAIVMRWRASEAGGGDSRG